MYLTKDLTFTDDNLEIIKDTLQFMLILHPLSIPGYNFGVNFSKFDFSDERAKNQLKTEISRNLQELNLSEVSLENVNIEDSKVTLEFNYQGKIITIGV